MYLFLSFLYSVSPAGLAMFALRLLKDHSLYITAAVIELKCYAVNQLFLIVNFDTNMTFS